MAIAPDTPLRFLPGIGPSRAKALIADGLSSVWDVLHRVPRSSGAPPPLRLGGHLPRGVVLRVKARLVRARPLFGRGRRRGLGAEADFAQADGTPLRARFFNAAWLRRHLLVNEWYLLEGRSDEVAANLLLHPSFVHLPGGESQSLPVEPGVRVAYRLPQGFAEKSFAALVERCLTEALPLLSDPAAILADAEYQRVLYGLHRPTDPSDHERGRRLLAQRELLALAWRLHAQRRLIISAPGRAWRWSDEIHSRAVARLPFTLTSGQEAALVDLRADLQHAAPMYRLLQGDVGSGKTALALLAALAVIADGGQVLLLAPTAVLARQHAAFIARCLACSRVRWAVLTGGSDTSERQRILPALSGHHLDLLVGTHALLEESVSAACLGLAIIDEQHKFGVEQRAALLARCSTAQTFRPDLLLMTATPIPRTLALTAFGDLAVSRIVGKPPGRAVVQTHVRVGGADVAGTAVGECLTNGGQAFVICPLRDESDRLEASDATGVHQDLCVRFGPGRVALLHGAMSEDAKLGAFARFVSGEAAVLVATTVIEVGIDVPQATLMVVLDADRFGLAQLHQLRGRIGRGDQPGRCLLLHRGKDDADRLTVLASSDDGLAIAEADLAARGPGHLLGTEQHGSLRLSIADLATDLDLLQAAHHQVRADSGSMPPGLAQFSHWFSDAAILAGG